MRYATASGLTIVMLGDWNKLYTQPDWIASNIFESDEMEIGVSGQDAFMDISFKCNNIVINSKQDRFVFSAMNTDIDTLNELTKIISNFSAKAHTPVMVAYGINIDYVEEDTSIFANVLDSIPDTSILINNGYQIESTEIKRALSIDDKIINMDCKQSGSILQIHFNEHHESSELTPKINVVVLNEFIEKCNNIVRSLGYELEGDEIE